jgi:hypothetical protein
MFYEQVRPYGEYFAKNQVLTGGENIGNQCLTRPIRLDASQGNTPIRMCAAKGTVFTSAASDTLGIVFNIYATDNPEMTPIIGMFYYIGGTLWYNITGETVTYSNGEHLCSYNIPQDVLDKYPYIWVTADKAAAVTGSVDIFSAYLGQGGR